MHSALVLGWKGSSLETKISGMLFLLTVSVSLIITSYIGSIDRQSLRAPEPSYLAYPVVHSDSTEYAKLAVRILSDRVYSTSAEAPYVPEVNWAPGYPLFMALSLLLFGSVVPLVVFQILLGGLTAVLIFKMARRFVPTGVAAVPALVFALDFSIAYYTSTAHTDGLFMGLLTILMYLLFFSERRERSLVAFLSFGVLLGVIALIRTIGQYLIVVIPVLYVAQALLQKERIRTALLRMGFLIVGMVLVMLPWMVRNHDVMGSYTLGNIGPKMFLHYYVKDFLTVKAGAGHETDFAQSDAAEVVAQQLQDELNQLVSERGGTPESHYQYLALKHMGEDPLSYGRFHIIGSLPYLLAGSYRHFFVSTAGHFKREAGLPYPEHENIAHKMTAALYSGSLGEKWDAVRSLSFVLGEVAWRVLLVLLALSAFLTRDRTRLFFVSLLALLVLYFMLLTGPAALTRYRIVSEPFFLTLAGIGGWNLYALLSARIQGPLRQRLREIFGYALVLFVGLAVDLGLLYTLTAYAGVWYLLAAGISFTTALIVNYLLSTRFVFVNRTLTNKTMEFGVYALIGVSALCLNQVLLYVGVDLLGIPVMMSKILVLPLTFLWNFGANKYFLFRKKE